MSVKTQGLSRMLPVENTIKGGVATATADWRTGFPLEFFLRTSLMDNNRVNGKVGSFGDTSGREREPSVKILPASVSVL